MSLTIADVIPLLREACPSFCDDEELIYPALGNFARHLLSLHQRGETANFHAVAIVVERLRSEGDREVREVATIGLLEAIQNAWSHAAVDPELFAVQLLPESRRWWDELNAFWRGERRYVGEGLQN